MKIQYQVEQLEKGMYVAELDRLWTDTPFLFQGFLIESDEELSQLRQYCKFVFVDDLKSRKDHAVQKAIHASVKGGAITVIFNEWEDAGKLSKTIKTIRQKSDTVIAALTKLTESEASNPGERMRDTRDAVVKLIDHISADPKTSQWMRILSEQSAAIGRHAVNTSILAVGFAANLGWDTTLQGIVGQGAMLHDVGMSKVPKWILEKPGKLSQAEWGLVKLHPNYAAARLENNGDMDPEVIEIVRHHHERLDGSGYPDGLSGDSIANYIQLVSICDSYDSHTTDQCYRKKLTSSAAVAQLTKLVNTHYNKELVEKFIHWIGIYPLGSLVRLRNNAIAIIVGSDEKRRLHPTVLMVRDQNGKALLPRRTLSLSFIESGKLSNEWGLRQILDPQTIKIDVRGILMEELHLR